MDGNEKSTKNERIAEILTTLVGAACIAVGITLVAFHDIEHYKVIIGLGAILLLFGIMHVTGYFLHATLKDHDRFDFSTGIVNIFAGLLLFFVSHKLSEHFSVVIGFILIFKASTWLQTAVEKRSFDGKKFHVETAYFAILLVFGIGFIISDFEEAHHDTIYHGVALVIEGLTECHSVWKTVRAKKAERKERFEEEKIC